MYKFVDLRLKGLSERIFLDRYAQKELDKSKWKVGARVVAILAEDPNQPLLRKTVTANIVSIDLPNRKVTVKTDDGVTHQVAARDMEYPIETEPKQMWDRVAMALASVEDYEKVQAVYEDFAYALDDWKIVPGGRVNAGAGTDDLTLMNCLSGDTIVQTVRGAVPIRELQGWHRVYSQDGIVREANFKSYGRQKLYAVTLQNGDVIKATAGHQWIVPKAHGKGGYDRVTTLDLVGRRIPVVPVAKPATEEAYSEGLRHGIVYGDGFLVPSPKDTCEVRLFGEKKEFASLFEEYKIVPHYDGDFVAVRHLPAHLKELPSEEQSAEYWYGFVVGLIATDGCCDSRGSVAVHQSNKEALEYIAKNLYKTGFVHAGIRITRELNPYTGDYSPCYALQLVKSTFSWSDLIKRSHYEKWSSSPSPRRTNLEVVSVEDLGIEEEVFCCEEPETHSFVIGAGYLTSNCFVIPSPHDSRHGIFATAEQMTEIMARGGGVGINLSTLRPKRAIVHGVNGHSSGAISWGGLYSYTTGLVEQGGSRRGALMLMLWDWHPDLMDFITAKSTMGAITNANLSVCVSDAFMKAVKEDGEWKTEFPITSHPAYDTEWDGDLPKWKSKGYPTEVYKTYKARDIWDAIIKSAWKSAEPGVVFMDMYNNYSNSWYFNPVICTNPCGRLGLLTA